MGSAWVDQPRRRGMGDPPPGSAPGRRGPSASAGSRAPAGVRRDHAATARPTVAGRRAPRRPLVGLVRRSSPSPAATTARARSPVRWPTRRSCTASSPACATSVPPSSPLRTIDERRTERACSASGQQAQLATAAHGGAAVVDAELRVDALGVRAQGVERHEEVLGDLGTVESVASRRRTSSSRALSASTMSTRRTRCVRLRRRWPLRHCATGRRRAATTRRARGRPLGERLEQRGEQRAVPREGAHLAFRFGQPTARSRSASAASSSPRPARPAPGGRARRSPSPTCRRRSRPRGVAAAGGRRR